MIVEFRLTYSQCYIRWRHRNPEYASLFARCPLEIQRISEGDAPIAHRIVGNDKSSTIVRCFNGRYWWPLLARSADGGPPVPASAAMFIKHAEQDTPIAADVLGCSYMSDTTDENVLFGSKPRLVNPLSDFRWETREAQWKRAERGADRLVFCGSTVLVEGGQPLYFGSNSYSRPRDLSIRVGPSNADNLRGDNIYYPHYSLGAPHVFDRRDAAAIGCAFGPREYGHEMARLGHDYQSVTIFERIEEILSPSDLELGPQTCARAFATALWSEMHEDLDDAWRDRLFTLIPTLAKFTNEGFSPYAPYDDLPHRKILEEYLAVDPADIRDPVRARRCAAPEILLRLRDEDAIASLAV